MSKTEFTSILSFVKYNDRRLYDAIYTLLIHRQFKPKKDGELTFLYPSSEKFRENLIYLANSDSEKESRHAAALISSLLIPMYLDSPLDFRRLLVYNKLDQVIEISDSNNKRAITKSTGASIESEPNFRFNNEGSSKKEQTINVLKLVGDGVGLENPAVSSVQKKEIKNRGKSTGTLNELRYDIALKTEMKYINERSKTNSSKNDVYLFKVLSLLMHLRAHDNDTYLSILPLLDYSVFTNFYILFEPYKTNGNYLIPTYLIQEWNDNQPKRIKNPINEFCKLFNDLKDTEAYSGLVNSENGRGILRNIIEQYREQVIEHMSKHETPKRVSKAYEDFVTDEINNQSVYSDHTRKLLSIPYRKQWIDEFRFIVEPQFMEIDSSYKFDQNDFVALIDQIRTCWNGNDYKSQRTLGKDTYSQLDSNDFYTMGIYAFLHSSDFLYIPFTQENMKKIINDPSDYLSGDEEYDTDEIKNLSVIRYKYLTKMIDAEDLRPATPPGMDFTAYAKELERRIDIGESLPEGITKVMKKVAKRRKDERKNTNGKI